MFYHVLPSFPRVHLDPHEYGYESLYDLYDALVKLHEQWHDKSGECINARHGFVQIRFRNEYGHYDDVWMPRFMVEKTPDRTNSDADDDVEQFLDEVFGFD